jgi:hypothetical protein
MIVVPQFLGYVLTYSSHVIGRFIRSIGSGGASLKIRQTVFIMFVSERQVDHSAIAVVRLIFDLVGDKFVVAVVLVSHSSRQLFSILKLSLISWKRLFPSSLVSMGRVEGFRFDIAGGINQIRSHLVEFLMCEVLAVFGQIGNLGFVIALCACKIWSKRKPPACLGIARAPGACTRSPYHRRNLCHGVPRDRGSLVPCAWDRGFVPRPAWRSPTSRSAYYRIVRCWQWLVDPQA